jgi:hypothetical protein
MMNKRAGLWSTAGLIYLLFTAWYTDFGGPLRSDEVEAFLEEIGQAGFSELQQQRLRVFMENDSGRQFLMVNNIDYNEHPPDVVGAEPGESAQQLMNRYMEHMMRELLKRACHPVVMGPAVYRAMDVVGIENAEHWDMGALMRYRSRRSFMEVLANPETRGRHEFKVAALDKTIAYPIETTFYLGDPRLILGLLLLSLTALLDILLFGRHQARLHSQN